ncbi:MAG: ATP-binding protein [Pseudomonadota bacterium]
MNKFVGRKNELTMLENAYGSSKSEFIPVYGRRRIGKSELILHFIEKKPSIYLLGKKSTPQLQIREFLDILSNTYSQPLIANSRVDNWKEALELIVKHKKTDKKMVVVFDEFQWLAETSPDLISILQEFIDTEWKKRKDIMLIICGSYMGFMEKEILGEKSPLFGRRTAQILLKPFNYKDAADFFPSWSYKDKAKAYFVCGGVPFYLLFFSENKSIFKNIEENFFSEFSALYREADFLLKEELRELQKYYAILTSLAAGSLTYFDISKVTGIEEKKLYYYIEQLIALGYVRRRYPLLTQRHSSKNVRFIIDDALLKFWFRFVYPNTAYIPQVNAKDAFQNLVKPYIDSYFGTCFENLCREALAGAYLTEGIYGDFEIGEYWDKCLQIDVVGHRKKEGIDICECKWTGIKSTNKLVNELRSKIRKYPNDDNLTIQGRIFSRETIKEHKKFPEIRFYSLEDIYLL